MIEPLRPRVAVTAGNVLDVIALRDGGYAVLTTAGIELRDATLAQRGMITADRTEDVLVAVTAERFLVHGTRMSYLYEGAVGGALQIVGEDQVQSVVVTGSGFLAVGTQRVLVDHAGTRSFVTLQGSSIHGGTAWRGGVALTGYDGLTIMGADGTTVAQSAGERLWRGPVALANAIAARTDEDIALFDGAARLIARIPRRVADGGLVAFRDGVLVPARDKDRDKAELGYWELANGAAIERWSVAFEDLMKRPAVAGDRVVASSQTGAWILDGNGARLAQLTTTNLVDEVAVFGDGIALAVRDAAEILWWRPGDAPAGLPHDVSPSHLRAVPAGLISAEDNILYLWSTGVQGPEIEPVESDLPMTTPIVIAGTPVQIVGAGRFSLRGMTLTGRSWSTKRGAAWRPMTPRDEASRLLERLVQRTFDGPLPAMPDDEVIADVQRKLGQLPLAETVDLHGRAMFAAASLEPGVRERSAWAREAFFQELGAALGTSARVLIATVKARKLKLEPPRPVAGYEYLGTFTTSGSLTVGDPCYVGKKLHAATGFALSLKVAGLEGVWHVFVRAGEGRDRNRTAELVTIHDDGFAVDANDVIGTIGVDSGTAGVFDAKCPKRDGDTPLEEGTFAGLGAIVSTAYGDGMYPVFAGKHKGKVGKLRLHFLGSAPEIAPEIDRSVARVSSPSQPYSATTKFAVGDTLDHVKFGTGSVIRVGGDGKIDVRFRDAVRTLVHARK